METLNGSCRLPAQWRGGIVALGNFDGVHRGHQAVVARAIDRARTTRRPALVATFDPHPVRYFNPDRPPSRLTTLDQRARLLGGLAIDAMVVLPFDAVLARLDPSSFFADVLIERMGIAGLVIGDGFRFGRDRSGDLSLLRRLGRAAGVGVEAEAQVVHDGRPVSSTIIRGLIRTGDVVAAARLLGRPFTVSAFAASEADGTSVALGDYVRPRQGLYGVEVRDGHRTWFADGHALGSSGGTGADRLWLSGPSGGGRVEVGLLTRQHGEPTIGPVGYR